MFGNIQLINKWTAEIKTELTWTKARISRPYKFWVTRDSKIQATYWFKDLACRHDQFYFTALRGTTVAMLCSAPLTAFTAVTVQRREHKLGIGLEFACSSEKHISWVAIFKVIFPSIAFSKFTFEFPTWIQNCGSILCNFYLTGW